MGKLLGYFARGLVLLAPLVVTVWLMLAVMAAERISVRFVPRHGWMAFVLAAAWANTHASFVLGFVVLALYALGELTAWLLWKSGDLRRARWYALVLLCAAPGTLLNPYGWALHVHVFRYLRDTELLSRVAEFQSFNFHSDGAGAVLAVLLVTLAGDDDRDDTEQGHLPTTSRYESGGSIARPRTSRPFSTR